MPALKATDFTATVTWLGRVADRDAALASAPVETLGFDFAGPEGEAHGGLTRPSCSRVLDQHPRGTEIRNVRQLTILSADELEQIARVMEIGALDPAWLGATLVLDGIRDFTHLPPSSRLQGP
ncbi:sulfurase, partial [Thioclava sp. BHET1]